MSDLILYGQHISISRGLVCLDVQQAKVQESVVVFKAEWVLSTTRGSLLLNPIMATTVHLEIYVWHLGR